MPDDTAAHPFGHPPERPGFTPQPSHAARAASLEGPASWRAAAVTLAILSVSYGGPLLIVVGLVTVQTDLHTDRSVLALAAALVWIGTGLGGVVMGRVAERIGMRATACFGAVMMAAGLALSATGQIWALYVGHGLLIGLLGNGAIYPPLVTYVSRWFDRRRGTAIALISSGQYIAGVIWPWLFERGIVRFGWRATMMGFAVVVLGVILPLALLFLRPPPTPVGAAAAPGGSGRVVRRPPLVLGMRPGLAQGLICLAGFCCCVPMAIPSGHLVAYCGSVGIDASTGAVMLSVLLGCAFVSRQLWGLFADRYGGLITVLTGSALQALAITAFVLTQNEVGLFTVSAAFGLGFAGIIPGYVLAIRELFPAIEAAWRVPLVLFTSMSGMAFGSWFAGALYDHFGYYAPAFGAGVLFNLANLSVVGFLVARRGGPRAGARDAGVLAPG
jgi:MFS family permease